MAFSASSVKRSLTLSYSNFFWYCLMSAFFGSVSIRMSAASSSSCSTPGTGRRPTNSGISPYLTRSSGCACRERFGVAARWLT